jgi:hypothetical protein
MKKFIYAAMVIMLTAMMQTVSAQNCEVIVGPYLQANRIGRGEYVQPKFEWRCNFSQNTFYFAENAPEGALVYNITELTNVLTGEHPSADITIDLNTFSYYLYNFMDFQWNDYFHTIYFRTSNPANPYLAVRSWEDAYDRTEHPENYKK